MEEIMYPAKGFEPLQEQVYITETFSLGPLNIVSPNLQLHAN